MDGNEGWVRDGDDGLREGGGGEGVDEGVDEEKGWDGGWCDENEDGDGDDDQKS